MSSGKIVNGDFCQVQGLDPACRSIAFENGKIVALGKLAESYSTSNIIDAEGNYVVPGFIDCYARLREPGSCAAANISSESVAALRAGITTIICAPDTHPVTDEPAIVEQITQRANLVAGPRILPAGALTAQLMGEQLSELFTLANSGCVAFSNADNPIENTQVIRRVMEYASGFNLKLIIAPQDPWLSRGVAHEGTVSMRMGLAGIPSAAETVALSQLIELSYQTGAQIHFSRLSTARGVNLVAQAKKDNIQVTADTGIHHLFFSDIDLTGFNSICHSRPPFRSRTDLAALREGVVDGTIDAISSNHAPLDMDSKLVPLPESDPGTSSLDGWWSLLVKLHLETSIPLATIINSVTRGPARCFDLPQGQLKDGSPADFAIVDTDSEWELDNTAIYSQGKNNPCNGWWLQGSVMSTIVAGSVVYCSDVQEAS